MKFLIQEGNSCAGALEWIVSTMYKGETEQQKVAELYLEKNSQSPGRDG